MNKIKVWMQVCDQYGPSIHNVAKWYREYAPSRVEFVEDFMDCDIAVDHLIGSPDRDNLVSPLETSFSEEVKCRLDLAKDGMFKIAYFMYCAIVPDQFYTDAFQNAVISTGYFDIDEFMGLSSVRPTWKDLWLRVPLGVNPGDFLLPVRKEGEEPEFLIYAWGASADPEDEYIRTIYEACKKVGGKMLHSGRDYKFDNGKHYVFIPPARTPQEVAQRYNSCWFANAMRAEPGFELANVEAPLANAEAVTLHKPCYEHFFQGRSRFVHEGPNMVDDLAEILSIPITISVMKKRDIIENFRWEDSVRPFWDKIMEVF